MAFLAQKLPLDAILKELENRFPDYAKLRESHPVRANADWRLCEKGLLSETDLLNIYTKELNIDSYDEDELIEPAKNELVNVDYLVANNCIPYSWSEEDMVSTLISFVRNSLN